MGYKFRKDISASEIRSLLDYEPVTGVFVWKVWRTNRCPAGSVAGSLTSFGYLSIGINGRPYMAHRLAWLHLHGQWPVNEIDHIDGDKLNNAISNLREASRTENTRNNKARGYSFNKKAGLYVAQIVVNKRQIYLGCFCTADEARAAYVRASLRYFGEFSAVRALAA